jgi:glycosyltransferase involved in cell wall biosynthesis
MHICFISNEFPLPNISFGGAGTFLLTYSELLIKNGHKVSIVGVKKGDEVITKINNVSIYYARKSNIKGFSWYVNSKSISNLIHKINLTDKIDILEAQEAGFAFVDIPKGIKKIVRMHGGHYFFHTFENKKLNWKKALLERITFRKADAIIATSKFVNTQTLKFINFNNKINAIINNPIPVGQFHKADKNNVIKGSVVFAGTVCEKKGIRQLCLAVPEIAKIFPKFHLYIYGRDWFFPDGKLYKDWLLGQLSDKIKSKITFRKPVPYSKLPKVYEFGEICIFPSHMEVQGLVAPEAMSMEKLVIFTKYGPGPETIDDGVDGFLCEPLKVKSISDVVIKVFNNRQNNREVEIRARQKVLKKFSPTIILQKNIKFYKSII